MRIRLVLASSVMLAAGPAAAVELPPLRGSPVVDAANVLTHDQERTLQSQIYRVNSVEGHQLAVATISSLEGESPVLFGNRLFREWGLGSREENDGVLLLLVTEDRISRIEVGYGLTPLLTDVASYMINEQHILPHVGRGDFQAALETGVEKVGEVINISQAAAARPAPALAARPSEESSSVSWWLLSSAAGLLVGGGLLGLAAARRRRRREEEEEESRNFYKQFAAAPHKKNTSAPASSVASRPYGKSTSPVRSSSSRSDDSGSWLGAGESDSPSRSGGSIISDSGYSGGWGGSSGGFTGGGGSSGGSGHTGGCSSSSSGGDSGGCGGGGGGE